MSELDWSPIKTPRAIPPEGARQGGGCPEAASHPFPPIRTARDLDDYVRSLPTAELERLMESHW